jgi:hypothetical protein
VYSSDGDAGAAAVAAAIAAVIRDRPQRPQQQRRRAVAPSQTGHRSPGGVAMLPPGPLQCTNQGQGGPTCGTSLNLMKRLM